MLNKRTKQDRTVIVALPNKSASWRFNKYLILSLLALSALISVSFALMGAWVILPFAGLEIIALSTALYWVCWKLNYRHVISVDDKSIKIEKGHYYPVQTFELDRKGSIVTVHKKKHCWDSPDVHLKNGGEEVMIGEFLNKDDTHELIDECRKLGLFTVNR